MKKIFGHIAICLLLCGSAAAQDIHFSQFSKAPLNLNPGFAGDFEGDYRFVGNQRRQWNSVTNRPFQTVRVSADAREPLFVDNLGAGISIFNDRAGDSRMNTFTLNLTGSYKITLPFDSNQTISPGLGIGLANRSIRTDDLTASAQYNGFRFDPDLPTQEDYSDQSRLYPALSLGAVWTYALEGGRKVKAGFSLNNITRPGQSFFSETGIVLDRRYNIHGSYEHPLNENIILLPEILFQRQGRFNEFIVGSAIKRELVNTPYTYRAVRGGLWLRPGDAGFASIGVDYDQWYVGASYDFNYSDLVPASNYRGGFELAVIYIFKSTLPERARFKQCPSYL